MGGGIAGVTAARSLRNLAPRAEVVVLETESQLYYLRPGLIDLLSGAKLPQDLVPFDRRWYESQNISYRPSTPVRALELARKCVILDEGVRLEFAGLILATGAEAFLPGIPGAQLEGVFTLRSLQDALEIWERAREGRAALVLSLIHI